MYATIKNYLFLKIHSHNLCENLCLHHWRPFWKHLLKKEMARSPGWSEARRITYSRKTTHRDADTISRTTHSIIQIRIVLKHLNISCVLSLWATFKVPLSLSILFKLALSLCFLLLILRNLMFFGFANLKNHHTSYPFASSCSHKIQHIASFSFATSSITSLCMSFSMLLQGHFLKLNPLSLCMFDFFCFHH